MMPREPEPRSSVGRGWERRSVQRPDHGRVTGVMADERIYTASRLKAELLGVLDDVAVTGRPVIVTKHGRAVARIVPMTGPPALSGSVTFNVGDDELLAPIGDVWDAERG